MNAGHENQHDERRDGEMTMPHDEGATRRETLTAITFVEIVDTLVDDFDVIEVLTSLSLRTVELLSAKASGILLADDVGVLRVMAASSEQVELLELFQVQNDEGPCLDSYHSGEVVMAADLAQETRWPAFAAVSVSAGYPSFCAIPMRLKDRVVGCLNLFLSEPEPLPPADVVLAQALADVASIAIVQDQASRLAAIREGHLVHALSSRIAIEQAKGMIAEFGGLDMVASFAVLRAYARNHNERLTEVAERIVAGTLVLSAVTGERRSPQ